MNKTYQTILTFIIFLTLSNELKASENEINNNIITPAGIMGEHVHLKGSWMLAHRSFFSQSTGIIDGRTMKDPSELLTENNPSVNTSVPMLMQMGEFMYAVHDRLTLMGMLHYMLMDVRSQDINGNSYSEFQHGFEDLRISALYGIVQKPNTQIVIDAGINIPLSFGNHNSHDTHDQHNNVDVIDHCTEDGHCHQDHHDHHDHHGHHDHEHQNNSGNIKGNYTGKHIHGSNNLAFSPAISWTLNTTLVNTGLQLRYIFPFGNSEENIKPASDWYINAWAAKKINSNLSASFRSEWHHSGGINIIENDVEYTVNNCEHLNLYAGMNFTLPTNKGRAHSFLMEAGLPIFKYSYTPQLSGSYYLNFTYVYSLSLCH